MRTELENLLLGRNPREVDSEQFHLPDAPSNPMAFGKWKEQVYLSICQASKHRQEECLKWIQMVENAKDVEELSNPEPFTMADRYISKILSNKMSGNTAQQYYALKGRYIIEGKMVKGRQMFWMIFQNYQVDQGSIDLY